MTPTLERKIAAILDAVEAFESQRRKHLDLRHYLDDSEVAAWLHDKRKDLPIADLIGMRT